MPNEIGRESVMNASIIVCTYNRADTLRTTLSLLSRQTFSDGILDIVVVDNNSSDNTKVVVDEVRANSSIEIFYVSEPEQGLSKARNTGIVAARGEVVIFIDDDAYPQKSDWAQRLVSAYADTTVGSAGGDAEPVWPPQGRPPWLHDKLLNYLGIVTFYHAVLTDLHYPDYPYGVNVSYRKDIVAGTGGFSTKVGRVGTQLLSGEEIELCRRIEEQNYRVVYVPDAVVKHLMAPERLTQEWFINRAHSQGITKASLEIRDLAVIRSTSKLVFRTIILIGSLVAAVIFQLGCLDGLALVARCKAVMSRAYLGYAVGKV